MDKDKSYELIGTLINADSYQSFFFEDYKAKVDSLMFGNICKDFINQILKESTCESELYNKGLETISFYILENSRKSLNTYNTKKSSNENENEILLQSSDMEMLGKNL